MANGPAQTTAHLRLSLLGGFELHASDGTAIELRSNKSILLLAYLALNPERRHSRERLIALLWSDRGERQGRASLRQALWELRAALPDPLFCPIDTDRETMSLRFTAIEVDTIRFAALAEDGDSEALAEAVTLYRGELLEGVRVRDAAFEDYLRTERGRYRDIASSILERLLACQLGDDPDRALRTAHRLLTLDGLHEGAHRAIMRLQARQGRADLALRQYETCRDGLARELNVAPQAETEALAESIRQRGEESAALLPPTANAVVQAPAARRPPPLLAATAAGLIAVAAMPLALGYWPAGQDSAQLIPPAQIPRAEAVVILDPITGGGSEAAVTLATLLSEGLSADLSAAGKVSLAPEVYGERSSWPASASNNGLALQGSVAPGEEDLRISVKLVDTSAGHTVWSERYNDSAATADLPDPLRMQVTGDVLAALTAHTWARRATDSTRAIIAFVRGWHHHLRYDPQAIAEFEWAIRHDPDFSLAHAALADFYWRCWLNRCYVQIGLSRWFDTWELAEDHIERAMKSPTALAYRVSSQMLGRQGRHEESVAAARKAITLDPDDAESRAVLAEALSLAGRPREALSELERASTELPSALRLRALGRAQFAAGRFEEAARALEKAAMRDPRDLAGLELLTAAYGHLGEGESAQKALARLSRVFWEFCNTPYKVATAEFNSSPQLSGDRALFLTGMRLAGVPD